MRTIFNIYLVTALLVSGIPIHTSLHAQESMVDEVARADFCAATDLRSSVQANFLSSGGRVIGESGNIQTTARLRNQSKFPLQNINVYMVVYPSSEGDPLPTPLATELVHTADELPLGYNEEFNVSWTPPEYMPDGQYVAYLHVSQKQETTAIASDLLQVAVAGSWGGSYNFTLEHNNQSLIPGDAAQLTIGGLTVEGSSAVLDTLLMDTDTEKLNATFNLTNTRTNRPWEGDIQVAFHRGLSSDSESVLYANERTVRLVPGADTDVVLEIPVAHVGERDTLIITQNTPGESRVIGQYVLALGGDDARNVLADGMVANSYTGFYEGGVVACWRTPELWPDLDLFAYELSLTASSNESISTIAADRTIGGNVVPTYIARSLSATELEDGDIVRATVRTYDTVLNPGSAEREVIEKVTIPNREITKIASTTTPSPENQYRIPLLLLAVFLLGVLVCLLIVRHYKQQNRSTKQI